MRVAELVQALDRLAPPWLAESWDNIGLLVGDVADEIHGPVFLTIDLTEETLAEAEVASAGAIIAYHPPIFDPLKRVTGDDPKGRLVLRAARRGIAVYSPHTALDAAPAGMAEWLAEGVGPGGDRRAILPASLPDERQTHKIVVFVPTDPPDALERVRNALASAGAGHIGAYELCSFTLSGKGTFFGGAGANPRVGEPGRLETVAEHRLEMVCPGGALPIIIETLKAFHPYEEPAFDVYTLAQRSDRRIGAGRRVTLDQPATPEEIATRIRAHLGLERVRLAEGSSRGVRCSMVGVCPGAGAGLLDAAIAQGCGVFVTGEMKHHDVLRAASRGCSVVLAGHTNTERGYLPRLAARLAEALPGLDARVSAADRDHTRYV